MMALIACLYGLFITYIFNETPKSTADLTLGLAALWNPSVLIFLLALWIVTFLYMGKSRVTAALVEIHVLGEKI